MADVMDTGLDAAFPRGARPSAEAVYGKAPEGAAGKEMFGQPPSHAYDDAKNGAGAASGTPVALDQKESSTPERPKKNAEAYTPERLQQVYPHAPHPHAPHPNPTPNPHQATLVQPFMPSSGADAQATRRRLNIDDYSPERAAPIKAEQPIHEIVAQLDSELLPVVLEAMEIMQARSLHAEQHVRHDISVSGAVEKLVSRMRQGGDIGKKAIATLQNLSAEVKADDFIKQQMVDCGLLEALLFMIQEKVWTNKAIATLMNLIIGSNDRKQEIVDMNAIGCLVPLMTHGELEERFLVVNVLTSLAIGSNERKHAIASAPNVIEVAIKLAEGVEMKAPDIRLTSLELIQSLILGSAERKKAAVDSGLIQCLSTILMDEECCQKTKAVASQLLKGFADYLGWESKDRAAHQAALESNGVTDFAQTCILGPLQMIGSSLGWWGEKKTSQAQQPL